jgi:hypothetical protein
MNEEYTYNTLLIQKIDEERRKASFNYKEGKLEPFPDDVENGYYIVVAKNPDYVEKASFMEEDPSKANLLFAQPLIGPVPTEEEILQIAGEIKDIINKFPEKDIQTVIRLWDIQYNLIQGEGESQEIIN